MRLYKDIYPKQKRDDKIVNQFDVGVLEVCCGILQSKTQHDLCMKSFK